MKKFIRTPFLFCAFTGLLLSLLPACAHAENHPQKKEEPMEITLQLTARTLGYNLQILEIRSAGDRYLALHQLESPPPEAMVGMALEELEVSAEFSGEEKPVVHFILGQERGIFDPPASVTFISNHDGLPEIWETATVIWRKPEADE